MEERKREGKAKVIIFMHDEATTTTMMCLITTNALISDQTTTLWRSFNFLAMDTANDTERIELILHAPRHSPLNHHHHRFENL